MVVINNEDIVSYTYDGTDSMIDFNSEKVPPVNLKFKAKLRLKNGKLVEAPPEWRKKIWNWWYNTRKDEIQTNILVQVKNDMLAPNNPMYKRRYRNKKFLGNKAKRCKCK